MPNPTLSLSGLKKMLYLPKHTYHRWHHNMCKERVETGAKGVGTPSGWNILTNVNCVLPAMWEGAHCIVVAAVHYLR